MPDNNPYSSPRAQERERIAAGKPVPSCVHPVESGTVAAIVAAVFFLVLPFQDNFDIPEELRAILPHAEAMIGVYLSLCILVGALFGVGLGALHRMTRGLVPLATWRLLGWSFAALAVIGGFAFPFLVLLNPHR